MGLGFAFKCVHCGKKYQASMGSGMQYPRVCRKLMKQCRAGKHGEKLQELCETVPYGTVDAQDGVYLCGECGRWKVEPILNFCESSDPVYLQHELETGKKVPCPSGWELKTYYRVIWQQKHFCSKCGGRMRRLKAGECMELPCPKCGEVNTAELLRWD